jgi:hypothetical protein
MIVLASSSIGSVERCGCNHQNCCCGRFFLKIGPVQVALSEESLVTIAMMVAEAMHELNRTTTTETTLSHVGRLHDVDA